MNVMLNAVSKLMKFLQNTWRILDKNVWISQILDSQCIFLCVVKHNVVFKVASLQKDKKLRQRSTTNWRFQELLTNTLGNNTIECKKLAKIVSGRKT